MFVWVWETGTTGAAIATVLGQLVTALEALIYLLYRKLPIKGRLQGFGCMAADIVRVGIAPFGLTLSPMISLMLINRFSMASGGAAAVACYACIAYALTIVQMLMQGVGDGSQPLMSKYYGEGSGLQVVQTRKIAYITALGLAVACNILLFITRGEIGALFGSSEDTSGMVADVIPIFLIGLVFMRFHVLPLRVFTQRKRRCIHICVFMRNQYCCLPCCLCFRSFLDRKGCGGALYSRRC